MTREWFYINLLAQLSVLFTGKPLMSVVAQMVKNLSAMQDSQFQPLGQEDPLEKGMATHSNILAWKSH